MLPLPWPRPQSKSALEPIVRPAHHSWGLHSLGKTKQALGLVEAGLSIQQHVAFQQEALSSAEKGSERTFLGDGDVLHFARCLPYTGVYGSAKWLGGGRCISLYVNLTYK